MTRPPPQHCGCHTNGDTAAPTMIVHETWRVTRVKRVSRIPVPPPPATRGRGRPRTDPDRRCLPALVRMSGRPLHPVHTRLSGLVQPRLERQILRVLLPVAGRFPTRHTWERRWRALPATLPAQIGGLGRGLVVLIRPWATCGRAAAIDRTRWRAASTPNLWSCGPP